MFTYKDLKTGMFGVTDTGEYFVVIGDNIVYKSGGYDKVNEFGANLYNGWDKIEKVYEGVYSFNMLQSAINGKYPFVKLVFDRNTDKPTYNGKVVCIDNTNNEHIYTVGKIYQFNDGKLTGDCGKQYPHCAPIYSFKEWEMWTNAKFIEIKE